MERPATQLRVFQGHVGGVLDVAFSDSGGLVATASTDGTGRVWDPGYATLVATLLVTRASSPHSDFSPGIGELIVTSSRDRMARIFDADSGTLRATLAGHEEAVRDAAFGADSSNSHYGQHRRDDPLWTLRPFPVLGRGSTSCRRPPKRSLSSEGQHRQRWPRGCPKPVSLH